MPIYLANIAKLPPLGRSLTLLMAPGRAKKALAFQRPQDQERSILAGLLLREVLGVAKDSDLTLEPFGRPKLAAPNGPCFSLSHSGPYVGVSVEASEHGLDIQELRAKPIPQSLARFALAPDEMAFHEKNPHPDPFVKLWTMKEAYLKATGRGLGQELNSFSVLPLESGPHLIANRPVYFYLSALPGAHLALVSLNKDLTPLIIDLNPRLTNLINLCHSNGTDSIPIDPIYTY